MRKILLIAVVCALTVCLLLYPENCLKSARNGLNLWFSIVLPSLLPFMAASFILLETGIVRFISHVFSPVTRFLFSAPGESAYVFLAAALSGYPIGAKLAAELYAKRQISEPDAQAIVRFTSVTGPVFITGAVSSGILGAPEAGIYLVAAHYLSAIITGIIFGISNKKRRNGRVEKETFGEAWLQFKKDIASCRPIGDLLSESIEKSLTTLIKIGGFIIVFSVLMEVLSISGLLDAAAWVYSPLAKLTGLTAESTKAMIIGGVELTTGCGAASVLRMELASKLPIISSIIAFGGMCIHMQTKSVCSPLGLKLKHFALAKSMQAFFAYVLCALSLLLFPLARQTQPNSIDIKTAVFYGIGFAAFSLISLLIIKYIQKIKISAARFTLGRKL